MKERVPSLISDNKDTPLEEYDFFNENTIFITVIIGSTLIKLLQFSGNLIKLKKKTHSN
jgi:hypothetical protein